MNLLSHGGCSGPASCSGRLFSFGVISDIQYANIENGFSFKKVPRFYRLVLPPIAIPYTIVFEAQTLS